jgi:serine/threonine protein kinase
MFVIGYVCIATWRSKNRRVACKIIEVSGKSSNSSDLQRSFVLELAAYRELSGPYILRTFAYATRELPANRIRGSTTQFMIVMELMGRGSLQNVLEDESNKLSLRRKLSMARQIASGMRRIHQHGMIHRDIRPDNILVNEDYIAKIGDMGIARVLDPTGQQTQMGCLQFMPPEFFNDSANGHVKCDEKLDIYTYGLTINQLFTETMHDARLNSSGSRITITKQSPIFYEDIILRCLDNDSKRRPTAVEIEKTLELYEQAFSETMLSDAYTKMNAREKDKVFLEFYQKNKLKIQRFVKEQFPQQFIEEIRIEILPKRKQSTTTTTSDEEHVKDPCRIS